MELKILKFNTDITQDMINAILLKYPEITTYLSTDRKPILFLTNRDNEITSDGVFLYNIENLEFLMKLFIKYSKMDNIKINSNNSMEISRININPLSLINCKSYPIFV